MALIRHKAEQEAQRAPSQAKGISFILTFRSGAILVLFPEDLFKPDKFRKKVLIECSAIVDLSPDGFSALAKYITDRAREAEEKASERAQTVKPPAS